MWLTKLKSSLKLDILYSSNSKVSHIITLLAFMNTENYLCQEVVTALYRLKIKPKQNWNSENFRNLSINDHRVVQFSRSVMSDSLQPHGLQHTRLPCPSPAPRACSHSHPSSQWCHPAISSSIFPFSSCLQSFPGSGSFPVSQFFTSCGQTIGASASASVLPMNIQDWFPLGWTGLISLQSKGLSRVFSNTTVQKQ